MIYKLRKRFIIISAAAVITVLTAVFVLAAASSVHQLNKSIDAVADTLAENDGSFPDDFEFPSREDAPDADRITELNTFTFPDSGFITPETGFTTRFFVVRFDNDGNLTTINTKQIASVTDKSAESYGKKVLSGKSDRGWISDFRYKKFETDDGEAVLFIDGEINRTMTTMFISSLLAVLAVTAVVIILLLVLFSKKAIKPIAESYDKQKRFITDASHELKTPLTVIMANLDIIEADTGKSEWIDDIRAEGENMTGLVKHLVNLSRMDENTADMMQISVFSLSKICNDAAEKFSAVAEDKGLKMKAEIDDGCEYKGDENLIRQLISILTDNAVKYCDAGGEISFKLKNEKHPVLEIQNTYSDVDSLEFDKLKERFYRADKARTSGTGYGIGLSVADSIVSLHKGKLKAYKVSDDTIGFKAIL